MYSVIILLGSILILRPGHVNEHEFYNSVSKYINKNSTGTNLTKNSTLEISNYNEYQR